MLRYEQVSSVFVIMPFVQIVAIPPLLGEGGSLPSNNVPTGAVRTQASEASLAKRSETVWTEIHITHTKTYT